MAKRFTVTLPARAKGNEIDYETHYETMKTLLRQNTVEVSLADRLVYTDGKVAGNATEINDAVHDALQTLLKRVRAIAIAFERMTMRVTDLDEMAVDDDVDLELVFPNKKPKTLEGTVRIKTVGGKNTKNRTRRPVEREEIEYIYDLQGLKPSQQLENKIMDITELGPEGASGRPETVKGVSVRHHTIPSSNLTFFYAWEGDTLKVYGIGNHTGPDGDNSQYDLEWFSGERFTYRR